MKKGSYHVSDKTKKQISEKLKGRHLSDETKQKLREAHLGKKPSAETRQKMSNAKKGRKLPQAQVEKIRKANIGKHSIQCAEETKLKISKAKQGKKLTEEHKNKIRAAAARNPNYGMRGKHLSQEQKKKVSEASKGRIPANKGKHIYNDGHAEKYFLDNELIPDNYIKGRLPFDPETIDKMKKSASKENHYKFNEHLTPEIIQRRTKNILKAKETNNSFNTSKSSEGVFADFLDTLGIEYKSQYKEEQYPFYCDFYIPIFDLFIELNHFVTHGKHPFNPENKDDILELKRLTKKAEEKNSGLYKAIIEGWTVRDVTKIQLAIKNNLNYRVSYNKKELYNLMNELRDMYIDACDNFK